MENSPLIVDSHQDIAWHVHKHKRDFSLVEKDAKAMITLPLLLQSPLALSCVTLFAEHNASRSTRRKRLERQLELYLELPKRYPQQVIQVRCAADLQRLRERAMAGHEVWGFILLMEGADLLESPAELKALYANGLRLLSLTWNERNQWAAGARNRGGLTARGAALLDKMRELGIVLDVSHLNEQSFFDVTGQWDGPLCATHSNAAALCKDTRNLTDEQLHVLSERRAVVGMLLYNGHLDDSWDSGGRPVPLSRAAEHIEHLVGQMGEDGVGIGSDFDGGLTPGNTPEGLNTIADLPKLNLELLHRGHSDKAVADVFGENWFRFFARHLPD